MTAGEITDADTFIGFAYQLGVGKEKMLEAIRERCTTYSQEARDYMTASVEGIWF